MYWIYGYWCALLFVVAVNVCFKCDSWLAGWVGFGYASVLVGYCVCLLDGFVWVVGFRLILVCLVV